MYVTDKSIYLQLQKTACTHIARLLADHVRGRQIGKHDPLSADPGGRFVFGSIRNPWDWYVSLWAFGCAGRGGLHRWLTTGRARGALGAFRRNRESVRNGIGEAKRSLTLPIGAKHWIPLYSDPYNPGNFREWLGLLLSEDGKRSLPEGFSDSTLRPFAGLFTYRYVRLYIDRTVLQAETENIESMEKLIEIDQTGNVLDDIIRVENMENDFIKVVEKAGHELSDSSKIQIFAARKTKTNESLRRDVCFYYDDNTADNIRRNEHFIIEKYGYEIVM